ncbi:unnamed protein product [Brassica rapa subsp. narinosa]
MLEHRKPFGLPVDIRELFFGGKAMMDKIIIVLPYAT